MLSNQNDTIVAIASASGGAARGIVRLSGLNAAECLAGCFMPDEENLLETKQPVVISGTLSIRYTSGEVAQLPGDLFWWPNEKSYTREPSAEFHTLGSAPLLEAALRAFCNAGARLAEPGEFTLRAFLAGRIDLTQAEAVLGVVHATGEAQLKSALQQLAGGLSRPLNALRDDIVFLLAELEAGLDFAEEEIEFISQEVLLARLKQHANSIENILRQIETRSETDNRLRVVLVGPVNAGKSSLFNALGREYAAPHRKTNKAHRAALVSEIPGTTRDYLCTEICIAQKKYLLVDTAGQGLLKQGTNIDTKAQAKAKSLEGEADILLRCLPAEDAINSGYRLDEQGKDLSERKTCFGIEAPEIFVWTKSDMLTHRDREKWRAKAADEHSMEVQKAILTSTKTGDGLEVLASEIERLSNRLEQADSQRTATVRCQESLLAARSSIANAIHTAETEAGEELIAAELHSALHQIGAIVGIVYTDDILDHIFSSFCIGK